MSAVVDYSQKRILLIDSSGNFRATIKAMLDGLGFSQVMAYTTSPAALEVIDDNDFDIILLGHNVRDRYTGMQLLEEARFRKLIKPTCSWILMTSDASQASVLFAIEVQPDEVLTKPFSMDDLGRRLRQLCLRRAALEPIERAIERNAINRAIRLCDSTLPKSSPNYHHAQMIKGKLLLDNKDYVEAKAVFERYYWSSQDLQPGFYLAECQYHLGELKEAQELLERLINDHELLIPAYDLLAKVMEVQGKLKESQQLLKQGVSRSPLSIARQNELGRLALANKDLNTAEQAYKKSIQLGEQSCQATPMPMLMLANVHRMRASEEKGRDVQIRMGQIDKLINQAKRRFKDAPDIDVQASLIRAQFHEDLGQVDEAQRCYDEAHRYARGRPEMADLESIKRELMDPRSPVFTEVKRPESEAEPSGKDPAMSAKVNRIGVRNYLAGKPSQAIRYFGLAFEYDAANVSALLNLAQLFLEAARDTPSRSEERLKMFQRYIRLAQRLPVQGEPKNKLELLRNLGFKPLSELPEGALGSLLK